MERVDRASRVVEATPERCFDAWMHPGQVATWLPPQGATMTVNAFDATEGGRFQLVLTFPAGNGAGKTTATTDLVNGRFARLVRPDRIEQDIDFDSDDPAFAGIMRVKWTFEPAVSGTRVSIACGNVPPGISPADHQTGLNSSLANLASYLESVPGETR